jgi:hypothetical protein
LTCGLDRSRGKDPNAGGKLAQLRPGRATLAVQQLDHQPSNGRLMMHFLGSQLLGVEQGVKRLVVFAPLSISLSEVQQVMGTALQRR